MSEVCTLCRHQHERGKICHNRVTLPGSRLLDGGSWAECLCTGPPHGDCTVKMVISEDIWDFYCKVSDRPGEEVIGNVLRHFMEIFR